MSTTPRPKPAVVEEAYTMLMQLGGNKFLLMTGAGKLMAAGRTDSNPNPWLRMDLRRNKAQVNRLKITLLANDTYTVEFYRQVLVDWVPEISHQQTFEMVYGEGFARPLYVGYRLRYPPLSPAPCPPPEP